MRLTSTIFGNIARPAGTSAALSAARLFEATKLGLSRWFLAMHLLTRSKNNVAALELMRHLGVCYKTAWLMKHERVVTGGGKASTELPEFRAVNTVLGNLKRALSGTYHAFDFAKYAHRTLAEAQYRFNRRFNLSSILARLIRAAVLTSPNPASLIRVAEVGS